MLVINCHCLQSPEACRSWLKEHHPEWLQRQPDAVAGATSIEIARVLVAKGLDWVFNLQTLPVPGTVSYP